MHRLTLVMALCVVLVATQSSAQEFPSRLVKIIVPFGAGGPADVTTRLIGKNLQEELKQPFVVENRPGAGAAIGTLEAAKGRRWIYAAD